MKNTYAILLSLTLIWSCDQQEKQSNDTSVVSAPERAFPVDVENIIDAHGGYQKWSEMKQMSFDIAGRNEHQLIELQSRKVRLDMAKHSIGFDGENVWLFPDTADVSRPRFYHNLFFYFFSMPFVLTDPGIWYETQDNAMLLDKEYGVVKVGYGENVGDSPKDNYKLFYDLETNQMEWLMYTVTFGKDTASDRFNLIRYSDWKDVNGLKLPTNLQWYKHEDGVVGEPRGDARIFENIVLSKEYPDASLFEVKEGASLH